MNCYLLFVRTVIENIFALYFDILDVQLQLNFQPAGGLKNYAKVMFLRYLKNLGCFYYWSQIHNKNLHEKLLLLLYHLCITGMAIKT